MSYKINYDKEKGYIAVTTEGDFALSTLKELAADIAGFVERYNCNRILNDMRRARLTEGTFNIYNMPKIASRAGIEPRFKRAMVVNELSSDYHFLETVFVNQGHIVKIFTDIDAALRWLLNKETTKGEPGDQDTAQA